MSETPTDTPAADAPAADARLYVTEPEVWEIRVKLGWDRERCHLKKPGEDFFHLLMNGELFVVRGHEKYCLACALRLGALTTDRLHWQNAERTIPLAD